VPAPELVEAFLPDRRSRSVLDLEHATRLGSFTGPVEYVGFRRQVAEAMARVPAVMREAEADYARQTGRDLGGPLPLYRSDDADAVLVTMGTATSTALRVVDAMRAEGHKVGLAKLRVFRPFPVEEMRALAATTDRIGVVDRSFTFGGAGAAATETRAAVYPSSHRPSIASFLAGIGGRDITPSEVRSMVRVLLDGPTEDPLWADLAPAEVAVHG